MKKVSLFVSAVSAAFLICASACAEKSNASPGGLESSSYTEQDLVWEENFDGSTLDTSSWNYETHAPGWVNAELQSYGPSTDNTYVKDGKLVIQAIKDGKKYTSGRINTYGKHIFKYGRFEAKLKVPSGKGFLPAFWMMPQNEGLYGQWPKCGEIDIMEVLGDDTNRVFGTIHFGDPHTQRQGYYVLPKGDFSKDFHVFAVEWEPGEIRWYVDGMLYYSANEWFTKTKTGSAKTYPAPFNQGFYIILNLAVGGSWPGNPTAQTKFGDNAQLVVDYVRVYQKKNYDENVKAPSVESKLRAPDADGNVVINGNFSESENMGDGKGWDLYTDGGGKAAAFIADGQLKVETKNAGSLDYSVQIIQPGIPIEKGCKYELSFDARADKPRTVIVAVSAPERNWKRYLADSKIKLSQSKQHYRYEFSMSDETDPMSRVEFNMGNQGSTATVYISNVVIKKIK